MMSTKIGTLLATTAALLTASAADAAVVYNFRAEYTSARDQNGNPIATDIATWTFTTANFITSALSFTPQSCVTNNVNFACSATQRAEPFPNGFGPGVGGDYIGLNLQDLISGGSGTGFYFFQPGALGQVGVYSNAGWPNPGGGFGNAGAATLTVSQANGAVPEPATWAMMILGFGTIGAALRRRSNVRTHVRFT